MDDSSQSQPTLPPEYADPSGTPTSETPQETEVKTEEDQSKDSQQTTTSPSTSSTALPPDPTAPWTESQRDEHIKEQAQIKEERLRDIMERIKTSGTIKPKDVASLFNVTMATARKYLREVKQRITS